MQHTQTRQKDATYTPEIRHICFCIYANLKQSSCKKFHECLLSLLLVVTFAFAGICRPDVGSGDVMRSFLELANQLADIPECCVSYKQLDHILFIILITEETFYSLLVSPTSSLPNSRIPFSLYSEGQPVLIPRVSNANLSKPLASLRYTVCVLGVGTMHVPAKAMFENEISFSLRIIEFPSKWLTYLLLYSF